MEWAIHGANVLILCSFLVRDMLLLRVLSIGAGVMFCLYFFHQGLMEPIYWNTLFSIVNITQIAKTWYGRRKIPLCKEERFIHEHIFPTLQPVEIRDLYKEAEFHQKDAEDEISFRGLGILIQGTVESQERTFSQGGFWGTQSFLQRKESDHHGIAKKPVSCLTWPDPVLRQWLSRNPNRNNLLLRALSRDLLSQIKS